MSPKQSLVLLCAALLPVITPLESLKATPPGSGWSLSFDDEFNDSALDASKWQSKAVWGTGNLNTDQTLYNNVLVGGTSKNILFSGSTLILRAIQDTGDTGSPYSSGLIASYNSFNQAFGYFEISAKMCKAAGSWPAFWFIEGAKEGAYNWPPEIDVIECPVNGGNNPPKIDYMTSHWSLDKYPLDGGADSGSQGTDFYTSSTDLSAGFHTYGLLWEPDRLVWYVDGVERRTLPDNVPYLRAMHIILNNAVGGWGGSPNASQYPADFEVDWARAYTRPLPQPWQANDIGAP